MAQITELKHCPSCGHADSLSPYSEGIGHDNSLGHGLATGKKWNLEGIDLEEFRIVGWRVCSHCSLIFCEKRPVLNGAPNWYAELFATLEHRDYDASPLPETYMRNQTSFANEMFETLNDMGVFDDAKSAIHFRCHAGLLAQKIKDRIGSEEVYGLEYFENPARHAAGILGAERVSLIGSPEPDNPFERATFDVILLEHILTHAHHPLEYLDYIKSLLSPTGKLVIFNEQDHGQVLKEKERYARGINFFHKQLYKRSDLVALLKSRGLYVREAPHPNSRKWTAAHHSMMFVCEHGETVPIPRGDVEQTVHLFESWWSASERYRKTRWITKPVEKAKKRLFG